MKQVFYELVTFRSFTFPPELKNTRTLDTALKDINHRWPTADKEVDSEQPIFILSAGWRSGSTLVQRLICSSDNVLIWGEPLGDSAVIPRMASQLSVLSKNWPPDSSFLNDMKLETLSEHWIANLTPPIENFKKSHRAFFDEWLAKPAAENNEMVRWGLKEVRLTIEHAKYLKWIYPNAKFIFVYRNLFDAYRSWRGNTWASQWPKYFSWSPIAYARHWKLLLSGYLEGCSEVGGHIIKFEELTAGEVDLRKLADYLGVKNIDSMILEKRIASPEKKRKIRYRWVTPIERLLLVMVAGKLMKRVGYL